jgi:hypothetical protein
MLRTNLSTRPFYNDRAVRVGIVAGVVFVAALTAFNVARIVTLNSRHAELATRAEAAEARAAALRQQAMQIRQTLDADDVALLQAAANEANLLIERRAFSWTDLFNRFEETLPADVRVAAVQPQVGTDGRMLIVATIFSRRIEDLDEFIEQLQSTRAFSGMLSRQDDLEEDGTLRSVIQGYYNPEAATTAAVPASTTGPDGSAPANQAPGAPAGVAPR